MLPALQDIRVLDGPEGYIAREQLHCDPRAKSGVIAFSEFVRNQLGGGDWGITRPCSKGAPSYHHAGQAWDWQMDADVPADVERVDQLMTWLLDIGPTGAPHEMFRRAGLRDIVWNKKIFTGSSKEWRPYTATGNKTIEHRDHVHFSFGTPGATGQTSFYRWLDQGAPLGPATPWPLPPAPGQRSLLPAVVGFGVGFGLVSLWTRGR